MSNQLPKSPAKSSRTAKDVLRDPQPGDVVQNPDYQPWEVLERNKGRLVVRTGEFTGVFNGINRWRNSTLYAKVINIAGGEK